MSSYFALVMNIYLAAYLQWDVFRNGSKIIIHWLFYEILSFS